MAQDFDQAMQARGLSSPLGKYTGGEVKTHLDDVTFSEWLKLCHAHDKPSGVLLRELLYLILHGKTPEEMSAQDTRSILERAGRNGGLEGFGVRP